MTPRYIRNQPSRNENAASAFAALLLATGVGVVVFYFVRLFLARDEVLPVAEAVADDEA